MEKDVDLRDNGDVGLEAAKFKQSVIADPSSESAPKMIVSGTENVGSSFPAGLKPKLSDGGPSGSEISE